jgi:hypothetical protein
VELDRKRDKNKIGKVEEMRRVAEAERKRD